MLKTVRGQADVPFAIPWTPTQNLACWAEICQYVQNDLKKSFESIAEKQQNNRSIWTHGSVQHVTCFQKTDTALAIVSLLICPNKQMVPVNINGFWKNTVRGL